MTFTPGVSGNPQGRRPGVRTRKAAILEALFEGEIQAVGNKCLDLAKDGDIEAIKVILARICPVRRGRPLHFKLPPINGAGDVVTAFNAVLRAASSGILTVEEAQSLSSVIESGARVIQLNEFAQRLEALEARL
jgi:hypothetical protein